MTLGWPSDEAGIACCLTARNYLAMIGSLMHVNHQILMELAMLLSLNCSRVERAYQYYSELGHFRACAHPTNALLRTF